MGDLTNLYDKVDPAALCHHIFSNTPADQFICAMKSCQNNFLEVMARTANDRGLMPRVGQWPTGFRLFARSSLNMRNLGDVGICADSKSAAGDGKKSSNLSLGERNVLESTIFLSRLRNV